MNNIISPEQYSKDFNLTLLTNDELEAEEADYAGIQRIGVDLEIIGKQLRQKGHDTRISSHSWEDLMRISKVVKKESLFVRINPPHNGTANEIKKALDLGADIIMLPYFNSEQDAEYFSSLVGGRARTILLVETPKSLVRIDKIASVSGIDEIMIGLNDIRLSMRLEAMEIISSPLMTVISDVVNQSGKVFSLGGLARHDQDLPVNPDLIYAQHPRLASRGAWLSRSFFKDVSDDWTLKSGVESLRNRLCWWASKSDEELLHAQIKLSEIS